MKHLALILLAAAGCARPMPADDPAPQTRPDSAPVEAQASASPSSDCALQADARSAPSLPAALLAVAPNYFHASHRRGFDAYRGGAPVFPWFDMHDLETPVTPPRGVRITSSSAGALAVMGEAGQLGLLERGTEPVDWTGEAMYAEQIVEHGADRWVLARTGTDWRVWVARSRQVIETRVPALTWDVRLGVTAAGVPVLAWVRREGGALKILVAWNLDVSRAQVVDEVALPENVAALSVRSRVELAIAADGSAGLGVAWRVLTDPAYPTDGSRGDRPMTPSSAQVRWLSVTPDGARSDVRTHATVAQPLGATTGVGPWGLSGNGMKASRLQNGALFIWQHEGRILGARADMDQPVDLAAAEGAPLVAFRPQELWLFDSSPRVRVFTLRCE